MRKLKISSIIFLTGITICLCAILALALSGDDFGSVLGMDGNSGAAGKYALVLEEEIDPALVRSLKIDYGMTFNDVFFYAGEGEKIIVREYMNFTPKEKQRSQVKTEDGELMVKGARRNRFLFFSFGSWDAYTEIYLPEGLAEQLEEVSVKTAGGGIFSEISLGAEKEFSVFSTSGDFSLPEVTADQIQAGSTSGRIYLETVLAEKLSVSTTSGDITLGQTKGNVRISSTSGNILLEDAQGDMKVSTTSGDISLGQATGEMDISSTSGIVRLREGKGEFDGDTVSGDVRIERLEGVFWINTTSGNISLSGGNGWGEAGAVSGDVRLFLDSLEGNITVSTTSGNVDLAFPETASLRLNFDSTSGACRTFFDDRLRFSKRGNQAEGQYGGGENEIRVSTVSGDLRITK